MLERGARAGLPALEGGHGGLEDAVHVELAVQVGREVPFEQVALEHLEQHLLALVAGKQAAVGVARPVEVVQRGHGVFGEVQPARERVAEPPHHVVQVRVGAQGRAGLGCPVMPRMREATAPMRLRSPFDTA